MPMGLSNVKRRKWSRSQLGAVVVCLFLGIWACSTTEKKEQADKGDSEAGAEAKEAGGPNSASQARVTLTTSLANNPLTSQTISPAKAESELSRFKAGKGELALQGVLSTERLARKSSSDVLATAKKLAELQMEKGANRTLGPEIKLEVALAALQSKNFALAEYFLQELTESKVARVKAGAYNAMGVVALRDDRVPEAVLYFREALKAVPGYKPAQLNLGMAALKGGEIKAAKELLSKADNDWFTQYAMISINRMDGDVGAAAENCDRVLKKQPEHAAALFNCGLLEYQNKRNFAKAKEYITRAGKAKLSADGWNERAFLLLSQIEAEDAQQKREEAQAKAAKAAAEKAKAAADKAKAAAEKPAKGPADKPAEKPKSPAVATPSESAPAGAAKGEN